MKLSSDKTITETVTSKIEQLAENALTVAQEIAAELGLIEASTEEARLDDNLLSYELSDEFTEEMSAPAEAEAVREGFAHAIHRIEHTHDNIASHQVEAVAIAATESIITTAATDLDVIPTATHIIQNTIAPTVENVAHAPTITIDAEIDAVFDAFMGDIDSLAMDEAIAELEPSADATVEIEFSPAADTPFDVAVISDASVEIITPPASAPFIVTATSTIAMPSIPTEEEIYEELTLEISDIRPSVDLGVAPQDAVSFNEPAGTTASEKMHNLDIMIEQMTAQRKELSLLCRELEAKLNNATDEATELFHTFKDTIFTIETEFNHTDLASKLSAFEASKDSNTLDALIDTFATIAQEAQESAIFAQHDVLCLDLADDNMDNALDTVDSSRTHVNNVSSAFHNLKEIFSKIEEIKLIEDRFQEVNTKLAAQKTEISLAETRFTELDKQEDTNAEAITENEVAEVIKTPENDTITKLDQVDALDVTATKATAGAAQILVNKLLADKLKAKTEAKAKADAQDAAHAKAIAEGDAAETNVDKTKDEEIIKKLIQDTPDEIKVEKMKIAAVKSSSENTQYGEMGTKLLIELETAQETLAHMDQVAADLVQSNDKSLINADGSFRPTEVIACQKVKITDLKLSALDIYSQLGAEKDSEKHEALKQSYYDAKEQITQAETTLKNFKDIFSAIEKLEQHIDDTQNAYDKCLHADVNASTAKNDSEDTSFTYQPEPTIITEQDVIMFDNDSIPGLENDVLSPDLHELHLKETFQAAWDNLETAATALNAKRVTLENTKQAYTTAKKNLDLCKDAVIKKCPDSAHLAQLPKPTAAHKSIWQNIDPESNLKGEFKNYTPEMAKEAADQKLNDAHTALQTFLNDARKYLAVNDAMPGQEVLQQLNQQYAQVLNVSKKIEGDIHMIANKPSPKAGIMDWLKNNFLGTKKVEIDSDAQQEKLSKDLSVCKEAMNKLGTELDQFTLVKHAIKSWGELSQAYDNVLSTKTAQLAANVDFGRSEMHFANAAHAATIAAADYDSTMSHADINSLFSNFLPPPPALPVAAPDVTIVL